jgi:hypothetical protein
MLQSLLQQFLPTISPSTFAPLVLWPTPLVLWPIFGVLLMPAVLFTSFSCLFQPCEVADS